MLNQSIVSQIGQFAQAADSAKAGDLSTLADVLRQLESLHGAARQPDLAIVRQVSVASSELIKRIMMDMDPGSEQMLAAVRTAAHTLAKGAVAGILPEPAQLPPELVLRPEPHAQAAGSGAETAYLKDEEILAELLSRQTGVL